MTARPDIGAMRHRVTLEAAVDTPGAGGVAARSWITLGQVWAQITPGNAGIRFKEARLTMEGIFTIRMRYRDGLRAAGRIVRDGRVFSVEGVRDVDEARRVLEFICREEIGREEIGREETGP